MQVCCMNPYVQRLTFRSNTPLSLGSPRRRPRRLYVHFSRQPSAPLCVLSARLLILCLRTLVYP